MCIDAIITIYFPMNFETYPMYSSVSFNLWPKQVRDEVLFREHETPRKLKKTVVSKSKKPSIPTQSILIDNKLCPFAG